MSFIVDESRQFRETQVLGGQCIERTAWRKLQRDGWPDILVVGETCPLTGKAINWRKLFKVHDQKLPKFIISFDKAVALIEGDYKAKTKFVRRLGYECHTWYTKDEECGSGCLGTFTITIY